jgi:uncharacterized protein (TIGR02594 family)
MSTDHQSFVPWLIAATAELGQHELPGDTDAPRILSYYRQIGHAEVRHDEVAWCAAFVGAMLEASGIQSTRSLMARSYLNWGTTLASGRAGAIAIFRRSGAPGNGHVAFWLGETADRIRVLGGNQGDAVSVITVAKADLLGLRWPTADAATLPPPVATEDANLSRALAHVLAMEGRWAHQFRHHAGNVCSPRKHSANGANTRTPQSRPACDFAGPGPDDLSRALLAAMSGACVIGSSRADAL